MTERAVGYGGGLALLFFRRGSGAPRSPIAATGQVWLITPGILGVFALIAENGTQPYRGGAPLHLKDRWWYRDLVGMPQINLTTTSISTG